MNILKQIASIVVLVAALEPGFAMAQAEPTDAQPAAPFEYVAVRSSALERLKEKIEAGDNGAALVVGRALLADPTNPAGQHDGALLLKQAAEAGITDAVIQYAGLLRAGAFGLTADREEAQRLYEQAAETGTPGALTALGDFIMDTQVGAEATARAIELFESAVALGDLNASNTLAQLYLQGRGVALDPAKALEYLDRGIAANSNASILSLADILRYGVPGIAADPAGALALYREAASRGDRGAVRRVADMTMRGEGGLAPDLATAEAMLVDLASTGDPAALQVVGDYYSRSDVVRVDAAKAVSFYEQSAAAGNTGAYVRLGDLYRTGAPGLAASLSQAIRYYEQGVAAGNSAAMRSLANIYLGTDFAVANPDRGIALLEDAANAGNADAAIQLGQMYATSERFLADYDKSKAYFDLAVNLGSPVALMRMGSAFATGPLALQHGAEALGVLEGAVASKVPGAAAELARLQLAGSFPGRGLEGVLSMLLDATQSGDATAARFLVQLYRDGYGIALQPDARAAENLLASVESLLGKEATAVERILLRARQGQSNSTFEQIKTDFALLSRNAGIQVLRQLRNVNARAYVFVVQDRLAKLGLYSGPLHGTLDSGTIRAIAAACSAAGTAQECSGGPLTDQAVQALGNFLYAADGPAV